MPLASSSAAHANLFLIDVLLILRNYLTVGLSLIRQPIPVAVLDYVTPSYLTSHAGRPYICALTVFGLGLTTTQQYGGDMPVTGQFPAIFNLSNLNGLNGFKINGETAGDESGSAVSAAGDVNGDGWADLIIGAYGHNNGIGRSYVIFGGPVVGGTGLIALRNLNASNGFKLDGENVGDSSGGVVNAAGDINADGWDDLIITADGYNTNTGRRVGNGAKIITDF